jgi:peptidoglycan/LPS O-acetylase OafA/YrhL
VKRIAAFEALRGALALWVVIGHVVKHAGYSAADLGPFALLAQPGYAVDVFIILSGFVIFGLLDGRPSTYSAFIVQRFFRLFPLYAAIILVSAATLTGQLRWVADFPWRTPFIDGYAQILQAGADRLGAQLAMHLTMLQGLAPEHVLPHSQYAILGQAWSISVEWQFYLVAPLLFAMAARKPLLLVLVLLGLAAVRSRYWLGEGFAVNQAALFLIGIWSYFLCKHAHAMPALRAPTLAMVVASAGMLVYFIAVRPIPLLLWIAMLGLVIAAQRFPTGVVARISAVLSTRTPQALGKISYSIYLTHFLVLYAASSQLLSAIPDLSKEWHLALLMPLTLFGTIVLSALTYLFIEAPGMALGHRLGGRIVPVPTLDCRRV